MLNTGWTGRALSAAAATGAALSLTSARGADLLHPESASTTRTKIDRIEI